jgi:predicted ester cyclase
MTDPLSVVKDYYDSFNTQDRTVHDRIYTDDALISGPGVPGFTQRGREVIRAFDSGYWRAFPGARVTVLEALCDGEIVLTRNQFTGVHGGPLAGPMGEMPATGKVLDRDYATRLRIVDGRITEFRIFFDRLTVLEDLGLLPALAGAHA